MQLVDIMDFPAWVSHDHGVAAKLKHKMYTAFLQKRA